MMSRIFALLLCATLAAGLARADTEKLLFDQGHGQRFTVEGRGQLDLSGLGFVGHGLGLGLASTTGQLTDESLKGVGILVISGPFIPFSPHEIDSIEKFVERGGGLAVMLHIGPPAVELFKRFNVEVPMGVVSEELNVIGGKQTDYRVADLSDHPITQGLNHFNVFGGWSVASTGEGAAIVARTSAESWMDMNRDRLRSIGDPAGPFGVIAAGERGEGRFAFFSDDAIFQNRFLPGENQKLAVNLLEWLAGD